MTIEKKRGRPRQFDRDEAIRVARRLFHAKGFDGAGVAELGAAMGIRPPSLYAAFGSKQALYELALDDYAACCGAWIPEILDREQPVERVIGALFEEAAKRYTAERDLAGCMILNGAFETVDEAARQPAKIRCAATRKLIHARLRRHLPDQAGALADYVMLILHGLSAGASSGWSKAAVRRAASSAAAGFELLAAR